MATLVDSASPTLALDTPDDLGSPITTAGSFVLAVDLTNVVGGDVLRVTVLLDSKVWDQWDIAGLNKGPTAWRDTRPYAIDGGLALVFRLEQTDGTGRTVPWRILRIDA